MIHDHRAVVVHPGGDPVRDHELDDAVAVGVARSDQPHTLGVEPATDRLEVERRQHAQPEQGRVEVAIATTGRTSQPLECLRSRRSDHDGVIGMTVVTLEAPSGRSATTVRIATVAR